MEYGVWSLEYGSGEWSVGVWSVESGAFSIEYGVQWSVVIWGMEYGVWSMVPW